MAKRKRYAPLDPAKCHRCTESILLPQGKGRGFRCIGCKTVHRGRGLSHNETPNPGTAVEKVGTHRYAWVTTSRKTKREEVESKPRPPQSHTSIWFCG